VPTRLGLLDCVERYFAAAPLPDARIAEVGGLDVPVGPLLATAVEQVAASAAS